MANQNTSHLVALHDALYRARGYLASAKGKDAIAFRTHNIMMIEKEIASEEKFLGMASFVDVEMNDDELLAELLA